MLKDRNFWTLVTFAFIVATVIGAGCGWFASYSLALGLALALGLIALMLWVFRPLEGLLNLILFGFALFFGGSTTPGWQLLWDDPPYDGRRFAVFAVALVAFTAVSTFFFRYLFV